MEINKERFEAWLYSQPRSRVFNLADQGDCLLCSFMHETSNIQIRASWDAFVVMDGLTGRIDPENQGKVPEWFKRVVNGYSCRPAPSIKTGGPTGQYHDAYMRPLWTAGELQDRFRSIFPSPGMEPWYAEVTRFMKNLEMPKSPMIMWDECISPPSETQIQRQESNTCPLVPS